MVPTDVLAQLPFDEASSAWLESRKLFVSERTYKDYQSYIRILNAYFWGDAPHRDRPR